MIIRGNYSLYAPAQLGSGHRKTEENRLMLARKTKRLLCRESDRSRPIRELAHNHKLYQVEETIQTSKVMVQDRIDGTLRIYHKDQALRFREIPQRPLTEKKPFPIPRMRKLSTPSTSHPWRGFKFGKHRYERARPIESQP